MMLDILYEDEFLVAIHKPAGLLVHKTKIAADATEFALQTLRDQIGQHVYPCHRIDRKTSGVLLFAKSSEVNKEVQEQFMNRIPKKRYLAIVRGYYPDSLLIDYPLNTERGESQESITDTTCLQKVEIQIPHGKHETSRYSLIHAFPQTGRMHQIRKHLAHVRHPIIGDRPHGCNKQNKLFLEQFILTEMMLHAEKLTLIHPMSKEELVIESKVRGEFKRIIDELGFDLD